MNIVIMPYDNAPEERVTNREAIKEALGGNAHIYIGTSDTCNNFIDDIEPVEEKKTDGEE